MEHDRQHRRLEAEEHAGDEADIAVDDVDVAEREDGEKAGQDKQAAGDQAALRAVQQPAEIDRQLLRLGAGQQHAVVERIEEPVFADPALLVDDDAMHHRDLAGRTAEAQRGDAQPDPDRIGKGDAVIAGSRRGGAGGSGGFRTFGHRPAPGRRGGQSWPSSAASRHQR